MPMLRRPETKGKQKLASQKKKDLKILHIESSSKGGLDYYEYNWKNLALLAAEA